MTIFTFYFLLFTFYFIIQSMFPELFKIGPLTIYSYGAMVVLGIIFAYLVSLQEAVRKNIDKKIFSDLIFWSLVWGFLGARLVYILVEFRSFLADPLALLFSRAGFVFYGGIIFGLGALFFLTRKYSLPFYRVTDCFALSVPLAHALGRIGCFLYGCCYGKATDSWAGVLFPPDSPAGWAGVKVIPVQLISALSLFFLFFLLFALRKRLRPDGMMTVFYLSFYSVFRFIIEFFRGDPRGFLGGFSLAQWISLLMLILSGVLLWISRKRRQPFA